MDIKLYTCVSLIGYLCLIKQLDAACTWPSDFVDSTWIDSLKGDLVFGTSTMTGWSFTVNIQAGSTAQTRNNWECLIYNETNSYLVIKAPQTFTQFVVIQYTAYRCLKLTKLTDASYRYYQIEPIQSSVSYERLTITENSTLEDISVLCDETQGYHATGSEFQVMIKSGSEGTSIVSCPYYFLSNYSFTYAGSDGSVTCNSDVGTMNLCSNTSLITQQSPACSPYTLYSSSSSVWCVDVVPVGTDVFISVFNGLQSVSSIDNSNTYSFACLGINPANTQASVTPRHCKKDQSTSTIPQDNSGTNVGATLSLTSTSAPCPTLSAPAKGSVSVMTSGATTTSTYTCDATYTLSGSETRTCQTDGTWSDTAPSCTCVTPTTPTNGAVTLSSDGLTVTYSCDVETVLIGVSTRTCNLVTNLWSGADPSCGTCETLMSPASGSYVTTSTGLTSIVTYSCDSGTTLNGATSRTCQTDTTWDLTAPTCTTCLALTDPASGNVTIATSGTTSTAVYACVSGYTLQGTSTATCGTDGTWSSDSPTCACNDPSTPSNGSVVVSADKTVATYTCDIWHTISGDVQRTCQTDGTGWSSSDPTCAECLAVSIPPNGGISVTSTGTVTMASFACNVGFSMSGSSTSQCTSDGTWSSSSPSCTTCETLSTPASGSFALATDGSVTTAQYTCDEGSSVSGDVTISCQSTGTWSSSTSCVTCGNLESISGGSSETSTNGTTTIASFTCSVGYSLVGETTATCQSDGTWNQAEPQCVLTTESTSSTDDTNSLLPAVIALGIFAGILLLALCIAVCYIRSLKKSINTHTSSKGDEEDKYDKLHSNGIPAPRAPMDHQQHILDIRNLSSSLAPASSNSPRNAAFTPISMKSAASIGSVKFDFTREITTGSMIMSQNQPAPWSIKKNVSPRKQAEPDQTAPWSIQKDVSPRQQSEPDQPAPWSIQKDVSPRQQSGPDQPALHIQKTVSPRKQTKPDDKTKGRIIRRKSKRGSKDKQENQHNGNKNSLFPTEADKKENKLHIQTHTNLNGEITKNKRSNVVTNVRASTPVSHKIDISDQDSCTTPRSNAIATVQ